MRREAAVEARDVVVNAVRIIGTRLAASRDGTHQAVLVARASGESEFEAFITHRRAVALEEVRLSSVLPTIANDNGWLDDMLRRDQGLPIGQSAVPMACSIVHLFDECRRSDGPTWRSQHRPHRT
jgi:hypothetical protein